MLFIHSHWTVGVNINRAIERCLVKCSYVDSRKGQKADPRGNGVEDTLCLSVLANTEINLVKKSKEKKTKLSIFSVSVCTASVCVLWKMWRLNKIRISFFVFEDLASHSLFLHSLSPFLMSGSHLRHLKFSGLNQTCLEAFCASHGVWCASQSSLCSPSLSSLLFFCQTKAVILTTSFFVLPCCLSLLNFLLYIYQWHIYIYILNCFVLNVFSPVFPY